MIRQEPSTLANTLAERGFVACACGAALKRAKHPWVCGRRGCDLFGRGEHNKRGRVDPYGAGLDCRSGGSSPAGSEPATATTKPRAGKAAEDALAALLAGAGYEVIDFRTWLWRALDGTRFTGFVREFVVGSLLADPRRFRADLFHPASRACIELEGGAHGIQRQRRSDIVREQLLESAGLRVVRVLPEQCHPSRDGTPPAALALVQAALEGGQSA